MKKYFCVGCRDFKNRFQVTSDKSNKKSITHACKKCGNSKIYNAKLLQKETFANYFNKQN